MPELRRSRRRRTAAWSTGRPHIVTQEVRGDLSQRQDSRKLTKSRNRDRRGRPGRRPSLPLPRGRAREVALRRRASLLGQARLRGPRVPVQGRSLLGRPLPRAAPRPARPDPRPGRVRPATSICPGLPELLPSGNSDQLRPAQVPEPAHQEPPLSLMPLRDGQGTGRGAWTSRSTWRDRLRPGPRRPSAMAEAGKLLNAADPARTIEHGRLRQGPAPRAERAGVAGRPRGCRRVQAPRDPRSWPPRRRPPGRAREFSGRGGSTTTASGDRETRPATGGSLGCWKAGSTA